MTMGLMACVAGVIAGALVVLSSKAAGQIAGVSVNAAVQGMAMLGMGNWYGDGSKGRYRVNKRRDEWHQGINSWEL